MLAGAHLHGSRLEQYIDLSAVIGVGSFRDRQSSLGLFGEAEVALGRDFLLTGALRYQRDSQDRRGALGTPEFRLLIDFDETFDAWLPRLSLAYAPSDRVTIGAMVQRAYNAGGTMLNLDTGEQQTFAAEALWSGELFARASLDADRLRLSVNLFRQVFRDAQRARSRAFSVPGGGTAFWAEILNVPEAWSHGLEASLDWQLSRRVRIGAGVGLLRTRIGGAPAVVAEGGEFQRAPHFTGAASLEWIPADGLTLGASLRQNGGYYSDDLNAPARSVGPATRIDARAALTRGRVTWFGYARNLLDAFHMIYLFSPVRGTAADPRELGLGLEVRL
jgi:outer membrane receptor protein involved in Fe transport